jgi:ADP-ribose pyrophosphatase
MSCDGTPARILSRMETPLSPWVTLVAKAVAFDRSGASEVYHCLAQPDYVAVLAQTPTGLIPLVRQYRPAVEAYTWELPAGLVESGEDPEQTCRRELKEETGLDAQSITYLGAYYVDTGRLENRLHAFYVRTSDPDPTFVSEGGLTVEFVDPPTLQGHVRTGRFRHLLHVALLAVAPLVGPDAIR